jgi:hypothetical protein
VKLKLTKTAVEGLPIPSSNKSQELHYDTVLPGFGVYVTPKGVKTYFVEGRSNGTKVRKSLGRHGVIFPDAAREEARMVLLGMAKGDAPTKKVTKTLKEMIDTYLGTRTSGQGRQIKPKTYAGYVWLRDVVWLDWHTKPVKQITDDFVVSTHAKLTKDRGPVCANNALRLLRATLNFGEVSPNPVHVLSRKSLWNPEKARKGFIKKAGVAAWIERAELLDGWMKGAVLMLLFLGLRKNEVLTLKQTQIRNACVVLEEGTTKNSDEHIVPMGPYLWSRIKPLLDGSEYLFQSHRSGAGHIVDIRKSLVKLGEDITVHDLRRTFVSHLNALEPAPSKYTIKRLMNHRAREDVTDSYIQIELKTLREVITRLEAEMVGTSQAT